MKFLYKCFQSVPSSFLFLLCTLTRSFSCGLQISVIFTVSKTYLCLELHGIVTQSYRCNPQSNDIYYTATIHLDNCGIVLTACLHGRIKVDCSIARESQSLCSRVCFLLCDLLCCIRLEDSLCWLHFNNKQLFPYILSLFAFGSEIVQFSLLNQIYIISSVNLSLDLNLSPFFVVVKEFLIVLSLTFYLLSIDIGFSPYYTFVILLYIF